MISNNNVYKITRESFPLAVNTAINSLQSGQVIATPTDTVYGLAALVQNGSALNSLYDIKGRDFNKPISICVSEIEDLYRWSKVTVPESLLRELLPGAVTLIFQRSPDLNSEFNPETDLVGIRIPNHDFVRQVCKGLKGQPLALTSANKSSHQSTLSVKEFEDIIPKIGTVFQDDQENPDRSRSGSTIVDLSIKGSFEIVRTGCALNETVQVLNKFNLVPSKKKE